MYIYIYVCNLTKYQKNSYFKQLLLMMKRFINSLRIEYDEKNMLVKNELYSTFQREL